MVQATGAGTCALLLSGRSAANPSGEHRVFVHPAADTVSAVIDALEALGGATLRRYDNFDFVAATIPAASRADLEADSRVALVEDDEPIEATATPVDDLLDGVDDLLEFGGGDDRDCTVHPAQQPAWGWERIGADDVDETGTGVDLAVLDTGIETGHCDLEVAGGRNFTTDGPPGDYEDRNGHGTHCAGIACALDNDLGVVGVAPQANLHAVKVLGDDGTGYHSWMAAGIDWCLSNEIELVSMSFGSEAGTATMDAVIERAREEGHLLVASAGNEGNDGGDACGEDNVRYPATHEDVIAVSAMDSDDSIASYSSLGDEIDLLAPGSSVVSTDVDNRYRSRSGTSMACPYVAGVAALAWARHGESGPGPNDEIRRALEAAAESVVDSCAEGHGLVRAAADLDGSNGGDDGDDGSDADDSTGGGSNGGSSTGESERTDADGDSGLGSIWQSVLEAIEGLFDRLLGRS
ncbi:peptidase S8 [Natrarchaeobius oligotrophus]|uniref:Peptidase S8 n=2 Tax=Natrarchaeobius TaxID=2501796 RepID=A0A3N6MSS7_NATCH|nr:peptidase S8 [Natrarchaeobius chitinivorans]